MEIKASSKTIPSALKEYCQLFNAEKFFEAHEVLELAWRDCKSKSSLKKDPAEDFFHGLIQIAACLVHVQKKNSAGARELFRTANAYLINYPENYFEIMMKPLSQETEKNCKAPGHFQKLSSKFQKHDGLSKPFILFSSKAS